MESAEPESGTGVPLNLTTILALLTLAGSVLLVSRQLSSDRPQASSGKAQDTIADQRISTRLWEDPFATWDKLPQQLPTNSLAILRRQIEDRNGTNGAAELLVVMVNGGAYSEDRESRIRSRFAVVSALGEESYDPEEPEHIGALSIPWPSAAQLRDTDYLAASAPTNDWAAPINIWPSRTNSNNWERRLEATYEWYVKRDNDPAQAPTPKRHVLVCWLNEDQFDDDPLRRLAMLLSQLTEGPDRPAWRSEAKVASGLATNAASGLATNVSLIGPRQSSTLRLMLGAELRNQRDQANPDAWWSQTTKVLACVSLFLAVPAAMDEVLAAGGPYDTPRAAVRRRLSGSVFKAVHSFSATEDQLAKEIFNELSLRRVNLTNPSQHLVLISEWDSFYGRMLSLTYAAELVHRSKNLPRADFLQGLNRRTEAMPTNLHPFVYLRGLDGQTAAGYLPKLDASTPSKPEGGRANAATARSPSAPSAPLEQLGRWTPDANKAEGQAQFDYLSRLGERIGRLGRELRHERRENIDAIGIVGSDIYDTLLILQALKPRFPNALFFTTDLDARLCHPQEWEWSRNLIVASGYGLQLHPQFQGAIPPFRNSGQTAQFAAVLAALNPAKLLVLTNVSPRRFEIGREGSVDLSTQDTAPHPSSLEGRAARGLDLGDVVLGLAALVVLLLLATTLLGPWRRLTVERKQFQAEGFWVREEDLGGILGFQHIWGALRQSKDPLAKWIVEEFQREFPKTVGYSAGALPGPSSEAPHGAASSEENEARMQDFLDFINRRLHQEHWIPPHVLEQTEMVKDGSKELYRAQQREASERHPFFLRNRLSFLSAKRRVAEDILNKLLPLARERPGASAEDLVFKVAEAAADARAAAGEKYRLRHARQTTIWICLSIFLLGGVGLAVSCWRDTKVSVAGEIFSLTSGTSVWPTEWLRFLALVLASAFAAESFFRLRTLVLDLTRVYRLPLTNDRSSTGYVLETTPIPHACVSADRAWERYQQMGYWWNRCRRILPAMLLYVLFGCLLMSLQPWPHPPARGPVAFKWDRVLLWSSILSFLFLTFWTMDATRLCRWLIQYMSEAPTRYPAATLAYFKRLRGLELNQDILVEWIDLRLVAELTEQVGKLVYFPFIVFFVLLISRNNWWDHWPWTWPLAVIFLLNLALVVASALILQRTAQRARDLGLESLRNKLDQMKTFPLKTMEEKQQHEIKQAQQLLDEIRQLRTGAFASLWENPILAALLLPSGGTALIELAYYFLKH